MAILPFPTAGRPCPMWGGVFAPSVNILGGVTCPDVDQTHLLPLSVELFPQQKPFHTPAVRQCRFMPSSLKIHTTSGMHFPQL